MIKAELKSTSIPTKRQKLETGSDNKGHHFKYKKNVILQQLLMKEKDDEANVILQCFRYMVDNNMFMN